MKELTDPEFTVGYAMSIGKQINRANLYYMYMNISIPVTDYIPV